MSPRPPRSWGRLAVRERLRAMLPATPAAAEGEEPPARRGLAMLLSVVVAAVLWFSFSMRTEYTDSMVVPVEIVSTPPDVALREPPVDRATVTLQGEGWTLLGLSRRRPTIRVAATGRTVDLEAALTEAGLPSGVQVQGVQPRTIELAFDQRTSRRLPIRLRSRVETAAKYDELAPPELQPDSVSVTGAQSLLGGLTDWPTEMLVASDVNEDVRRRVALSDTFGGLLVPSVRSTLVRLRVGEFTEERRMLDIELVNKPPDVAGVRFVPARVGVTYRVPLSGDDFDEAQTSPQFRAVVDYLDIARDTTSGRVNVIARWPQGLTLRDVELSTTRVEYFIQRTRPRTEG